jgi:hypothetical protein
MSFRYPKHVQASQTTNISIAATDNDKVLDFSYRRTHLVGEDHGQQVGPA